MSSVAESVGAARIVAVGRDDYRPVAEFLTGFPGFHRDVEFWLDRFALWWESNPAFSGSVPRGWLLRHDQRVVGFCGIVPSRFQHAGRETVVFTVTTWMVAPEHRSESLRLFLKVLGAAKDTLLFCTTPGDATVAVLGAMRFHRLPRAEPRRSVIVLDPRGLVAGVLRGRVPLAAAVASIAGAVLAGVQAVRLRCRVAPDIEVRDVQHAGVEFDELWRGSRGRIANTNVRDAEAVNWLCFTGQDFRKQLFACYRGGRLCGYAVFRSSESTRLGLRVFECLDIWPGSIDRSLLAALAATARAYAARHGHGLVVFPHFSSELALRLKAIGLLQTAERERRGYVRPRAGDALDLTSANSYLVSAQGDDGV